MIEDAAEAIGSVYRGSGAGSMGRFGVFSFHGTKTLTTGEGGMFVTNDPDLYERVLTLSNHGRARGQTKQFWPDEGWVQIQDGQYTGRNRLRTAGTHRELIDRKREILDYYRQHLETLPGVAMNPESSGTVNGAWMPTIVFDRETGVTREKLLTAFAAENVDARVFFWPLSSLPMFEPKSANCCVDIPTRAINLPSYHDLTSSELDRVCSVCLGVLDK